MKKPRRPRNQRKMVLLMRPILTRAQAILLLDKARREAHEWRARMEAQDASS